MVYLKQNHPMATTYLGGDDFDHEVIRMAGWRISEGRKDRTAQGSYGTTCQKEVMLKK